MSKGVSMLANKDLMKGTTVTLVLKVINTRKCYGYDIIKRVKELSGDTFNLKEGTLYPILHTLENDKLIESSWSEETGQRKRKYYKITRKGKQLLGEKQKEWESFRTAVDQLLATRSKLAGGLA